MQFRRSETKTPLDLATDGRTIDILMEAKAAKEKSAIASSLNASEVKESWKNMDAALAIQSARDLVARDGRNQAPSKTASRKI